MSRIGLQGKTLKNKTRQDILYLMVGEKKSK